MKENQIKDIVGYEGKYAVSSDGNVWSYPKARGSKNGKWLKIGTIGNGYKSVCLGRAKNMLVHRLVAQTFIKNHNNKPCVNHKDGNKSNNCVSNLEWVTYSENEKHSYSVLNKKPNKTALGKFGIKNTASIPVIGRHSKTGEVLIFDSASEAGRNGFCQGHVSACARGETTTHKKYYWRYITKEEYLNNKKSGKKAFASYQLVGA